MNRPEETAVAAVRSRPPLIGMVFVLIFSLSGALAPTTASAQTNITNCASLQQAIQDLDRDIAANSDNQGDQQRFIQARSADASLYESGCRGGGSIAPTYVPSASGSTSLGVGIALDVLGTGLTLYNAIQEGKRQGEIAAQQQAQAQQEEAAQEQQATAQAAAVDAQRRESASDPFSASPAQDASNPFQTASVSAASANPFGNSQAATGASTGGEPATVDQLYQMMAQSARQAGCGPNPHNAAGEEQKVFMTLGPQPADTVPLYCTSQPGGQLSGCTGYGSSGGTEWVCLVNHKVFSLFEDPNANLAVASTPSPGSPRAGAAIDPFTPASPQPTIGGATPIQNPAQWSNYLADEFAGQCPTMDQIVKQIVKEHPNTDLQMAIVGAGNTLLILNRKPGCRDTDPSDSYQNETGAEILAYRKAHPDIVQPVRSAAKANDPSISCDINHVRALKSYDSNLKLGIVTMNWDNPHCGNNLLVRLILSQCQNVSVSDCGNHSITMAAGGFVGITIHPNPAEAVPTYSVAVFDAGN